MLMNILLNFLFIPKYGALAAATTTLVCEVIQLIIMSVVLSRTIPIRNEMNLAKITLATIVMSGVIISIKNNVTLSNNFWNVILTVLLAIFTYNLVAIIFGTIRRYELRLLFKN
jgi:O-antigen/teichoic acid export membrane protein